MSNFNRINELKELNCIFDINFINESDLYLKDENNQTFFEYIIKQDIKIYDKKLLKYITNNYELLKYATLNEYIFIDYYNVDLLFKDVDQPLIELIFKIDPNNMSFLSLDILNRLFVENNGEYLIKKFMDINQSACLPIIKMINDFNTLYNCFNKINRLDLMKYANESCLLTKTPNGVSMMQELINMKVNLDSSFVSNVKNNISLAEILYKNKKYDLMLNFDCQLLLNYPTKYNNYFSQIINHYKNGEKINFEDISLSSDDNKSLAICILTLLKNKIQYNPFDLIKSYNKKHKPVIIHMLEIDRDLTIGNFFKNTRLVKELEIYILELNNCSIDELKDFNVYDIFKYLPKKETLIKKLKSKEKNKIEKNDIFVEDLLEPMEDGLTLLEYALKNNIDISDFETEFSNNFDAIMILEKFNYKLDSVNEKFLYIDIGENKKFIDLLFEKNDISCIKKSCEYDFRILDYCIKYNDFSVLSYKMIEELLVERNGNFLIEKYLDNDNFIEILDTEFVYNPKLLKLYSKGYKKILINASEDALLMPYNGMTVLEDMLKSNIIPSLKNGFESIKIMEILYSYNIPDLMYKAKLDLLMNFPNKELNYMQYLIDCCKKGINVHLELINYLTEDKELSARVYIQMFRNDFEGYLNELNKEILTEKDNKGKSLLYYLINLDKDLTLNKILTLDLKRKFNVYSELKLLGISEIIPDTQYDKFDCSTIYRKINNEKYAEGIVSPVENLLDELRILFYQDGKSDKELIDALIISYRYTTSINKVFIEELKLLIQVKKNNPNFCYIKKEDAGCFDPYYGVLVENSTISILDHETGHALHYFLAENEIPENYESLILSINSNPNFIKKIEEYSIMFIKIKEKTKELSSAIVSKYVSEGTANTNREEFNTLLSKEKEERKKLYLERGYSVETLDIIFSDSFTLSEFIKQKRNIEIGELRDTIMRYDYDALIAIGDIIDAITKGYFKSNLLKNENNEKIAPASGHGIRYYSSKGHGFDEMVANYSSIIKSKHSNEMLILLRSIVGDELVDLLDEFYKTKIIGSTTYEKESDKVL